jgi:hypothetical protein
MTPRLSRARLAGSQLRTDTELDRLIRWRGMNMQRAVGATVVAVISLSSLAFTANIDSRLASVSKAFIVPADAAHEDDRAVAACLVDKLPAITKIVVVGTREEADVILKVKGHIPGAGTRYGLGMMGGTPSANLEAQLPDGTKLWSDGAKNRTGTGGIIGAARSEDSIACGLADRLSNALQDAMRNARFRGKAQSE